MVNSGGTLPRILYGAVFVVLLPAGLALWAHALAPLMSLPAVWSAWGGAGVAVVGAALMLGGMGQLVARGEGLPMNAFPTTRLVRTGLYRWIRNPIYVGFTLAVAGVALGVGSAAGLWIVTPTVALGSAALWFGFERHALMARFGTAAVEPVLLSLPPASDDTARPADRVAVLLWVLGLWLLTWLGVQALGAPPDRFHLVLPFERTWPVLQFTELGYASTYLFVPLTPLLIRRRRDLRHFAVSGLVATGVVTLIWLTVPVVAWNRPFTPDGPWGRLLAFEQAHSTGVAAFPAFHLLWALFALQGWLANARVTGHAAWRWVAIGWTLVIAVSCLTTGMHTVPELLAALVLYFPLWHYRATWGFLRRGTERLANSWREWRIGPVRIINHGLYPAAGAFLGSLVVGILLGPAAAPGIAWVGVLLVLGAGLTAQALEGSSKLLRPFGWYGGLAGSILACLTAPLFGVPTLPLLAAFAVVTPWIQIAGRLRCLVQGCCHGGPADDEVGIRYQHRRSRVIQIASLAGVPLHPTPLYSILGNVVIGVLVLRLWSVGAPLGMVLGTYFILASLARFVEESYRGEPQTKIVGGLRVYQWMAVAGLLLGITCTVVPSGAPGPVSFPPTTALWAVALAMGLLFGVAMGVDFPGSDRRFSRLAAAD